MLKGVCMIVGTHHILEKNNIVLLSLDDVKPDCPIQQKNTILNYVFSDSFLKYSSFGLSETDKYTGEKIPCYGNVYTDGDYSWSDLLGIYLILHNIELPDSFIEHIVSKQLPEQKTSFDWRSYAENPHSVQTIDIDLGLVVQYMSLDEAMFFITDCENNDDVVAKLIRQGYTKQEDTFLNGSD